jgi:hypothetical protein
MLAAVDWSGVFIAFLVSHAVGDWLLQTEWQATHKRGGLGRDAEARRALVLHVTTYTLAFVPALVWLADDLQAAVLALAAAISLPHMIQDDGRLLGAYMCRVKGLDASPGELVTVGVDQSFHIVTLLGTALVVRA